MKKRSKQQKNSMPEASNLVAKHAHYFNKAIIFKDKSKYQRKAKHKSFDPFVMRCMHYITNGSNAHKVNTTFEHNNLHYYEQFFLAIRNVSRLYPLTFLA